MNQAIDVDMAVVFVVVVVVVVVFGTVMIRSWRASRGLEAGGRGAQTEIADPPLARSHLRARCSCC